MGGHLLYIPAIYPCYILHIFVGDYLSLVSQKWQNGYLQCYHAVETIFFGAMIDVLIFTLR